jgi:hypothetical protein
MIDATTWYNRWAQGMNSKTDKIVQGVQSTTKDPIQLAIAAAPYWQRQVSSSAALTAYKAGLGRSSKAAWATGMINKGIPNISTGVSNAQAKMVAVGGPLMSFVASASASIAAMPKGKGAANEARMLAFSRRMAQFRAS